MYKKLKILLWNVWLLPSLLTDGKSKERAGMISKLLNDFDIVVLNEAFTNKCTLTKDIIHPYVVRTPRTFYKLLDSGLMILSKYPVDDIHFLPFTTLETWDQFSSKGILKLTVNVGNNMKIDIYGTHLQAGSEPSHHDARLEQVNEVYKFIKNHSQFNIHPIVLCGDLNCGPVLDQTFTHFSGHYDDAIDAKKRDYQYRTLVGSLNFNELYSQGKEEDICRFLYKDGVLNKLKELNLSYIELKGPNNENLSDTSPVLLELKIDTVEVQEVDKKLSYLTI